MKELCVSASLTKLDEVMGFLEEELENMGCSMKASMQIQVSVEEIFANIASYAYPEGTEGTATIQIEELTDPKTVKITMIDSGSPFDPLAKEDPDITLGAEERGIGGLGILMVKKSMDDVQHEYADGENRLTLFKHI